MCIVKETDSIFFGTRLRLSEIILWVESPSDWLSSKHDITGRSRSSSSSITSHLF